MVFATHYTAIADNAPLYEATDTCLSYTQFDARASVAKAARFEEPIVMGFAALIGSDEGTGASDAVEYTVCSNAALTDKIHTVMFDSNSTAGTYTVIFTEIPLFTGPVLTPY
jgi:hypothetical protein